MFETLTPQERLAWNERRWTGREKRYDSDGNELTPGQRRALGERGRGMTTEQMRELGRRVLAEGYSTDPPTNLEMHARIHAVNDRAWLDTFISNFPKLIEELRQWDK